MRAGIVGLGLIGGSFAKAYSEAGHEVLAFDRDESVLSFAQIEGAVSAPLTKENIGTCDIVLVAIYPEAAIAYVTQMAPYIGKKPMVIDCCGTKRVVCRALSCWPQEHGLYLPRRHPMAGTHNSGFKYARVNLYHGAPDGPRPARSSTTLTCCSAPRTCLPRRSSENSPSPRRKNTTRMIAFTSQLAHVVSNAYIKSPTAGSHKGFSAGSYKDMTRVAWLNPQMWAELFLENRDYLMQELSVLSENLAAYQKALETQDLAGLTKLLDDGKRRKEEVDGR